VSFYIGFPDGSTGLFPAGGLAWPADMNTLLGSGAVVELTPGPTTVDYPGPLQTRHETLAGSVVVQQPLVDNRPRSWIWSGYPERHPTYQALWNTIQPLRSRYRAMSGDTFVYVFLMEDETKQLRTVSVVGDVVTEVYPWLKVRVLEVSRKMRASGGSMPVYEETRLTFTIEDVAYNDLG